MRGVKVVTEQGQHSETEVVSEMKTKIENGLAMIKVAEIEMGETEEVVSARVVIMEILIGIVMANAGKQSPLQKINVSVISSYNK